MPEGDLYPKCFDPYLRYAISTEFQGFEFFQHAEIRLLFLVEFHKAGQAKAFAEAMASKNEAFVIELGPGSHDSAYATVRGGKSVALDRDAYPVWDDYVSRAELSLPLKPGEPAGALVNERWKTVPSTALLIGVLDDGCPFAAAHFLRNPTGSPASTRVRALWDQNRDRFPVTVNGDDFGAVLSDFKYGLEYLRESTPGQIGLDDWMQMHMNAAGSIDEDGCYADAAFRTLARRASHGAHGMDVFAGRVPTSARIGPAQQGQDRRDPPSWAAGTDSTSGADMVFVQFPEYGIRDATGVWLKAYVVDGIRYIMSFADPKVTRNVIVNISYGPTTGPHDGTAVLEQALADLVAEFDSSSGTPTLQIVLAAGNSYGTESHVAFTGTGPQPQQVEWIWRLPPDNSVLCFAEIWMANADAGGITVTLISPTGVAMVSPGGSTVAPPTGVPLPVGPGVSSQIIWGSSSVWLLAVGPTIYGGSEHGDYTIRVAGIRQGAQLHAYVARSDPNMGVRTGARRSYFVDPVWERTRSAEASCRRANGEFDRTGSLVERYGTLNGIATAQTGRVHVAGGFVLPEERKAPYASAGAARGGPRTGPDYAMLCDESYALGGIRAGGNRSGGVFRLIGTSAAAPQLGRHLARLALPPPSNVPAAGDLDEIRKRGQGNLEPP
jgi:hypothetical protein